MLEPDHAPNYTGSTGNLTDMENSEKLEYLAPRLQSQQWISPYYMAWVCCKIKLAVLIVY